MLSKVFCTLVVLSVLCNLTYAQGPALPADPTGKKITPPSPDVWQFAKYGEYPVSRDTGVPNISIPIYTVQSGDLSVPISLSYHAGGIKVDDIASNVGLGWTLNAGGVVSRTVNVRPDESQNGLRNLKQVNIPFVNPDGIIDMSYGDISSEADYQVLMNMKDGLIDTEPDVFNYSIGGYAGKFFLDPNPATFVSVRSGISQPKEDVKIDVSIVDEGVSGYQIPQITITTPDGTRYIFTDKTLYVGSNFNSYSSWYLTRIESNTGKDAIHFFYRDIVQQFENVHRSETHSVQFVYPAFNSNPVVNPPREAPGNSAYNFIKVLERIEFPNGKVVFNTVDDTRLDGQKTRLSSIDIISKLNPSIPVKSIILDNDQYFLSSGGSTTNHKRLKLKGIQEKGSDGKLLPPHEFTYLETGTYELPPRLVSKSQDYWGYYNGKTSNPSLVPQVVYPYYHTTSLGSFTTLTIGNADRNPDAERMKAGVLQKIKYPTSGWTEFQFESNEISRTYWNTPPPSVQPTMSALVYNTNGGTVQSSNTYSPTVSGTGTAKLTMGSSAAYVHGYVYIKDNGVIVASYTDIEVDTSFPLQIQSGHTYEVFARASDYTLSFVTINWSVPQTAVLVTADQIAGGLRVKNIKSYDYSGSIAFQKHYSYDIPNTTQSSGNYNTGTFPTPESFLAVSSSFSGNNCEHGFDMDISVTSHPANALGFPTGAVVNYEYVTEKTEEATNDTGKIIYRFDVGTKDRDIGFVFPASVGQGHLRGQPVTETYLNSADVPVKTVQFIYDTIGYPQYKITGLKLTRAVSTPANNPCLCCFSCSRTGDSFCNSAVAQVSGTIYVTYDERIVYKRLRSRTEEIDGVSTVTAFQFDPQKRHNNIVVATLIDSQGKEQRTIVKYAHEVMNTTMIQKNMIGIPLESEQKVNGLLTTGSRLTYGTLSGVYIPVKYEQKLANGTYRTIKDIVSVNSSGKIEEHKGPDGVATALKWDYNNQYLLTETVNAKPTQIAFTSFENGGSEGGWSYNLSCTEPTSCLSGCPNQVSDPAGYAQCNYACQNTYNQCMANDATSNLDSKTGKRSFLGTSITKTALPVGNYVVSFWAKKSGSANGSVLIVGGGTTVVNSTDWTFYQISLTAVTSITISLSGTRIDDMRLQPQGSQMTTYSTSPLIGVTAISDPNNKLIFYEYDSMLRVKLIRDHQRNILKTFSYNYKDQQ